jgi:hypothetical protein
MWNLLLASQSLTLCCVTFRTEGEVRVAVVLEQTKVDPHISPLSFTQYAGSERRVGSHVN